MWEGWNNCHLIYVLIFSKKRTGQFRENKRKYAWNTSRIKVSGGGLFWQTATRPLCCISPAFVPSPCTRWLKLRLDLKEEALLEMFTSTCLPPGDSEFMAVSHSVGTAELCRTHSEWIWSSLRKFGKHLSFPSKLYWAVTRNCGERAGSDHPPVFRLLVTSIFPEESGGWSLPPLHLLLRFLQNLRHCCLCWNSATF